MSSSALIIPAFDEEEAIGPVVSGFSEVFGGEIVVVDNNSRDKTAEAARAAGATVVFERGQGYGSACLAGIQYLRRRSGGPPEIVIFADGDGSNDPADLEFLIAGLHRADLAIGSRTRLAEAHSLSPPQRFGNALATQLIHGLYGVDVSDLGPFRAIRWQALEQLEMRDLNYGWTVEMQVKAAKLGLRVREVDVRNRPRRAGKSKISRTAKGVVFAGTKIIGTILRHR